ncbi:titin isoform X1 [Phyllopteryx taeniolatus]|uniref:titin isoform X1 n=1 Tax=Phyllopteryx taeniolatus TaxID=161469 RepID=UPI002AD47238|nr:titin isoform X1 [Phyllopteryx taeniolatus]
MCAYDLQFQRLSSQTQGSKETQTTSQWRPMTRSFSANGRTSSFSEEDSSSLNGRTETRSNYLSNVRPENSYSRYSHYRPTRSTLCTVMAQLTEDVQPSFETTLKSKAVSENCNVKFTCVVSGYPAPELKWYKDDMEMDRYCGLPKYEIHKNGKLHTLHIYKCTLDDAAIYQVSASNSKGIVSCSGVLEVGTMSEFKIHQRFFAKLKQKAEKKRKDLDELSKKEVKDNIQTEEPCISPEPPPRKRPVPSVEPVQAANEPETVEQLHTAAGANGVSFDVKETASAIPLDNSLEKDIPAPEELVAKKKPKITNGVDAGVNTTTISSSSRGHMIGNGSENCYDGGISLAQFLSENLQSQTDEEIENLPQLEKTQEMDVCIENASTEKEGRLEKLQAEKEQHETAKEKENIKEKELVIEMEKEKERLQEMSHLAEHPKHHRKALKDNDHHNIQSSISSMLHTVKDFFFGKGKKDSHEYTENKDKEHDHVPKFIQPKSTQSQTPPSYRLYKKHRAELDKAHMDQVVPMEIDKPPEPSKSVDVEQQSVSKKLSTAQERKVKVEEAVKSPIIELPPGRPKEPTGQSNQETGTLVDNMEVSAGEGISGPGQQTLLSGLQVLTEAEEKHTEAVTSADMVLSHQQESETLVASPRPHHPAGHATSSPRDDKSLSPTSQSFPQPSSLIKDNHAPPLSVISAMETSSLYVTPTLQGGEINVDKMDKDSEPDREVNDSSKKLRGETKANVKELPRPYIIRPEVAVLTPPSLEKGKPAKEVNYPTKKLCVKTEQKLMELPRPALNRPEVAVLTPPPLEKGKPAKEVNYPTKKLCVETEEKLKELPRPGINRPKVAVLTPSLLVKCKPDKEVNYPTKKLCVKTEEKLMELPRPALNRPEVAVLTPPPLEKGKPAKEVNYPTKKLCVKTEEKLMELPRPDINRPEVAVLTLTLLEEGKPDKELDYPSRILCVQNEEKLKEIPRPDINRPEVSILTLHSLEEGKPAKQVNYPTKRLCVGTQEKLKEVPCPDINRPEVAILTPTSLEEAVKIRLIKAPVQTVESNMEARSSQRDHTKEEAESVSLIQEMNVGFLPAAAPKMGDLKMWSEYMPFLTDESKEDSKLKLLQSSESGFKRHETRSERKEGVTDTRLRDIVENLNNLKEQKQVIVQLTETNNDVLEMVTEEKKPLAVANELKKESVKIITDKKDHKEVKLSVVEEASKMAHQGHNEKQQCSSENVPLASDISTNKSTAVPRIEIIEPQPKQFTLPLTILALKKIESDPSILEKHLKPQAIAWDVLDSSGRDHKPSPSDEAKELLKLDDKTEIILQARMKDSQQLPQVNYATIPQINVSSSDDKKDHKFVNTQVLDSLQPLETSTVPLFVVPPISVTCHENESEPKKTTHTEWTETETLVVTQSVRQRGSGNDTTAMSEKPQDMAEQSLTENISSMPNETVLQRRNGSGPSLSRTTEDNISLEKLKENPLKQAKIDSTVTVEDLLRSRAPVERLAHKPPTHPSLSPGSIRKFMSKAAAELESDAGMMVPVITVDDRQRDKADDDTSGGSTPTSSTPTSSLSCESSPRLKRRDSLSLIRSATPEELASGARRKIFIPKAKEDPDEVAGALEAQNKKESPYMSPSQARRAALLQAPVGQNTPPTERRSPLMNRRKTTLEVPKVVEEPPKEDPVKGVKEEKVAEKKFDPLKAPQVIRKIRGEPFPDASGHLKLWCQFFNILSDSTIKWFRDEEEILEVKRSAGDETQVALAIVLAASQDCGVYGCTIQNEYGTDTTDFLLSVDILSDILLREALEVGEEIEMTPLLFTKGLATSSNWGDKYFGRIMTEMAHIGEGVSHKASRVKVIYGLNPVYESGSTCIIKVPNPIAYGTKQDNNLIDRNLEMTKQECKIQNMIREYCKIFAAEARAIENFGSSLEVIPQYLMYRPANSVPYATVEVDLKGVFLKYCATDGKGCLIAQSASEMEQKCSTFQHWIHQWTHGNLLITRMEGVETKITNVRVVTKTKGYQGLTDCSSPEVFEQFPTVHQCNYYCGLLGLCPLKTQDQQQTTKVKGSKSPLLNRKLTPGSGSPQPHRKGHSPQMPRKANVSPKVTRKVQETKDIDSNGKLKPAETTNALEMR